MIFSRQISPTDRGSNFTILRPRKSAKRPLVTAPIIAPIVNIDPNIANCRLNVTVVQYTSQYDRENRSVTNKVLYS
jgi:hypothetical protein